MSDVCKQTISHPRTISDCRVVLRELSLGPRCSVTSRASRAIPSHTSSWLFAESYIFSTSPIKTTPHLRLFDLCRDDHPIVVKRHEGKVRVRIQSCCSSLLLPFRDVTCSSIGVSRIMCHVPPIGGSVGSLKDPIYV